MGEQISAEIQRATRRYRGGKRVGPETRSELVHELAAAIGEKTARPVSPQRVWPGLIEQAVKHRAALKSLAEGNHSAVACKRIAQRALTRDDTEQDHG